MVGVDTIFRLIGGTLALVVIGVVAGIGYQLIDPIYQDVIDPAELEALGWGAPHETIMLFGGLSFIGLSMVVIIWWVVAPARQDVRQEAGPPL